VSHQSPAIKIVLLVLSILFAGTCIAADPPAEQPESKSVRRVRYLKQAVRHFGLHLYWRGETQSRYEHNLTLSVEGGWYSNRPTYPQAKVTAKQAEKIIDYLVNEGLLERATDESRFTEPKGPGYTMRFHVDDDGYFVDLGWGLPMLKRLDALRKVLDGDAVKKMDVLLGRLKEQRKVWEQEDAKAKSTDTDKEDAH
jgi:hypothetical protein